MLKRLALLGVMLSSGVVSAQSRFAREVWIHTENYGEPTALLTTLQHAIKQHPRDDRFHIYWGMAEPHGGNGGTLIYDKKRWIVWVAQDSNSFWPEDEEAQNPIYNRSASSQQWRFSRVTPNRLLLLFRKYSHIKSNRGVSDTAYEVSFLPRLVEFGAKGGLVGRSSRQWREKLIHGKWVRVR